MNKHFLVKLGEFFRSNKGSLVELSEDDIVQVIRSARAHSGGKQKAENSMNMSELMERDGEWRLFFEREFAEPPATIQVLPKPGVYSHPRYGQIKITSDVISNFVNNHNDHVYQESIPIDAEHQGKLSGAMGYFKGMRLIDGGKGGAEADVEWTDKGKALLASDRFRYFSPEWFDSWNDPANDKKFTNVLVGGAITTRPFFKDKALRPLVANEDFYQAGEWAEADPDGHQTLTLEPMSFAEADVEDDGDTCEKCGGAMDNGVCTKCGAKQANIDTGDVHVNEVWPDQFRDYSSEQRKSYAKSGVAMPDGSYPIPDKGALSDAIHAYGRSPDEATKNHIKARARALGASSMLPEKWTGGAKAAMEDNTPTTAEVDDKTKEFVETQTKKLTEELDAEKGRREAAESRLLRLEGEAQARRFNDIIGGNDAEGDGSPPFLGQHATHHKTMALFAREYGEDSDEFKAYVEEQRSISKQAREAGLFKEVGVGTGNAGGVGAGDRSTKEFGEKVDAWLEAHPDKNRGEATIAVSTAQPKLYVEMLKEQDKKAKKAGLNYGYGDDEEDDD